MSQTSGNEKMLGKNPQRDVEHSLDGQQLRVHSIWQTIQGEGPFAGRYAIFVRMAGCNLQCHFCDTEFDKNWDALTHINAVVGKVKSLTPLKNKLVGSANSLVIITGGEPLIQNIVPLIHSLLFAGTSTIQIETAGTAWPRNLELLTASGRVHIVCSPKTKNVHPMVERWCRDYKYVIAADDYSSDDGLPIFSTQNNNKKFDKVYRPTSSRIWLQPRDDGHPALNKANIAMATYLVQKFGYNLSLQMHKIVGLE